MKSKEQLMKELDIEKKKYEKLKKQLDLQKERKEIQKEINELKAHTSEFGKFNQTIKKWFVSWMKQIEENEKRERRLKNKNG